MCLSSAATAADVVQPNVILILADDLAVGDLSANNGGRCRTPNLDRLATQSVRFTQAYSASCVCAPARAALLTGRYPHRTGVVTLNMNKYPALTRLHLDEVTLPDVMRANNYRTGLIGKWHCGSGPDFHPLRRGFDEFEGFSGSQELSYFRYRLDINGTESDVDKGYLTDDLSGRAIDFVRRHRNHPFFLHLAHYAPHRPIEAPAELVKTYTDSGLDQSTATIYAMIEVMDRGIGELMNELERLKLSDQTIVIFASDNGPDPLTGVRFNQELRGTKYQVYEGGIRVPLFIRSPGRFAAGQRDQMVHFVDLFPTVLDLCGIQYASKLPLDGESFRDVLVAESSTRSTVRYWQWNRGQPNYTHNAAIREGRWKLTKPYVNRKTNPADSELPEVLYDLESDPSESRNVAAENPGRVDAMRIKLSRWADRVEQDRKRKIVVGDDQPH